VLGHYLALEIRVLFRIELIERRSQNGDGLASGLYGRLVRAGVNPKRQAADHHDAALGQTFRQVPRARQADRGHLPRPDDGHLWEVPAQTGVAGDEKRTRGVLALGLIERPQQLLRRCFTKPGFFAHSLLRLHAASI
jgi:hypothetical protein